MLSDDSSSGQAFSLPFPDIAGFRAEIRADQDYLPIGIQELLIIRLVMDLFQGLVCGTIEFKLEYVNVFFRLRYGINAADARTGFRFNKQSDEP